MTADGLLDDRKSAILRAVVQQYIETAQPVGSTAVAARPDVAVSSATVRNDMTVLERDGYLAQPHTSAGRVPTEKGYRYFVDHLGPGELAASQARQVRSFFDHAHGELEQMLQSTSRLLAQLTSTTAVVVGEPVSSATIRSVQLVSLGSNVYLIVVVLSSGSVIKRTVERREPIDEASLARVGAELNAHAHGVRPAAVTSPGPTGDAAIDEMLDEAAGALRSAVAESGRSVFVEGASKIASAFDATSTLQKILGLLEQQITVVTLLSDVLDRGLTVAIGSETGVAPLSECSLVVAPYRVGGEQAGTIGVLGPTRMNYQATLAAVAVVSRRLSNLLTEG